MLALVASLVLCALLTFAPGTVLERVSEDDDFTLAEGLRFADAALDSGTKQREGVQK